MFLNLFICLAAILSGVNSQQQRVFPEILLNLKGGDYLEIGLRVNRTQIVLQLHLNRYLQGGYSVMVEGVRRILPPPCQYLGQVAGEDDNTAAITTCTGIRGTLLYKGVQYSIAPTRPRATYSRYTNEYYGRSGENILVPAEITCSHTLRVQEDKGEPGEMIGIPLDDSGEKEDHHPGSRKKRQVIRRKLTEPDMSNREIMEVNARILERKYIEISVLIDQSQYIVLDNDMKKTVDFITEIFNQMSPKFLPYNVVLSVKEPRILKPNELAIPNDYSSVIKEVGKYRTEQMKDTPSDFTVLISAEKYTGVNETNVIGAAPVGGICEDVKSVGVHYDKWTTTRTDFLATLIAHELGHNLGMKHDQGEEDGCPCDREGDKEDFCGAEENACIMASAMIRPYGYFSTRSRTVFESIYPSHHCLYNPPPLRTGEKSECGNAIVEQGEQCDCGSEADCPILDPCCQIGTCQLKNTSSCYTGSCCTDECQFKPSGTVCRPKVAGMECDFAEECTGTESTCPVDTYKQDGRQCKDQDGNTGFCSSSNCATSRSYCKYVFGDFADVGPEQCFKENLHGNHVGNCGVTDHLAKDATYIKCEEKDINCGMLHCKIPSSKRPEAQANLIRTLGRAPIGVGSIKDDTKNICVYARQKPDLDEDEALDPFFVDGGQVPDYTPCALEGEGPLRYCKRSRCTYEPPQLCPMHNGTECGGHGECNNLNQCHCDPDWSSGVCAEFTPRSRISYNTIIIVLSIMILLVGVIVGVVVYIVKHRVDMKRLSEMEQRISRGIRRFSTRAFSRTSFSRQSSNRSEDSQGGNVKMPRPLVNNKYSSLNKNSKSAPPAKPAVKAKPVPNATKSAAAKRPPPPPKPAVNRPPPPPPAKVISPPSSLHSSQEAPEFLRNAKEGLRSAAAPNTRTHSDTFKQPPKFNLLSKGDNKQASSETNLTKKSLQPPSKLAGKSREQRKLEISTPHSSTGHLLIGLDGRPKSVHSAMDIKPSGFGSPDFSSTRALFDKR